MKPIAVSCFPGRTNEDSTQRGRLKRVRSHLLTSLFTLLIGCAAARPLSAQATACAFPAFDAAASSSIDGLLPGQFTLGDFNGDSLLDLAYFSTSDRDLFIYAGTGCGHFELLNEYSTGTFTPVAITNDDLNGDGILDLIVPNRYNATTIYLGAGDGSFSAPLAVNQPANCAVCFDLNGDGFKDLALGRLGGVRIRYGDGAGGFSIGPFLPWSGEILWMVLADADGDGVDDLLASDDQAGNGNVVIWNGDGNGGFGSPNAHPVGSRPAVILARDLDGDGDVDVATLDEDSNSISLLRGLGGGTFSSAVSLGTGNGASGLTAADVNGDGVLDLVCTSQGLDDLSFFHGDGQGGYLPREDFKAAEDPSWVAADDIDLDGNLDLVVMCEEAGSVVSFMGNNGGGLAMARPHPVAPHGSFHSTVADFDQDGNFDLAVAVSGNAQVHFGDGTGHYQPAPATSVPYPRSQGATSADFNSDGIPDLAIVGYDVHPNGAPASSGVMILLGSGNGQLQLASATPSGWLSHDLETADFDRDGHADLLTVDVWGNALHVHLGDGSGGISSTTTLPTPQTPRAATVADVNLDGWPDVILTCTFSVEIVVWLGGPNGFGTPTQTGVPLWSWDLTSLDFDLDGIPDLARATETSVVLYRGDGTGGFAQHAVHPLPTGSKHLIAFDLNGDGIPELISSNLDQDDVTILDPTTGQTRGFFCGVDPAKPLVADFDNDGRWDLGVPISRYDFVISLLRNSTLDPKPVFSPSTPCGQDLQASVGVPLSFEISAQLPVSQPGNQITLSVSGTPMGAHHSTPLPITQAGNTSVTTTFQWTPGSNDLGTHVLDYSAQDALGNVSSCQISITVAECYLVLGSAPLNMPLANGDRLLTNIEVVFPVTMESIPTFFIPNAASLSGSSIFAQVAMLNPIVFPNDPIQLSHGLEVVLGSHAIPYGNGGSGMTLWMPAPPLLGTPATFDFEIPGF